MVSDIVWRFYMRNKILRSILSVASVVLLASLVTVTGVMYQYFDGVQSEQLKDELRLAAEGTTTLGKNYLENLQDTGYRLTWVDTDGTVLFDNQADAKQMENHADREEIMEAFTSGMGSSSRYSTTLTKEYLYEAVRLADGSVLRISESRATVVALLLGMAPAIVCIAAAAILLSLYLADKMAKRVVEPLNRLDLDHPLENVVYEELSPLLRRIHGQQEEIREQVAALHHKQEEFDQITGNMKEALILLDDMEKVISINPAAKELFGTKDCLGEDFFALDRTVNMRNAIEQAKEAGEFSFQESRNFREYQFEVSTICLNENICGTVILGFDVTDRVNAEKNRREFTANVSHELKTPIQSIIGSAELLENGVVQPEDVPRFVGNIHREASRMVSLIDDIIRLSQLDEGKHLEMEQLNLYELGEEVCEELQDIARQYSVSLHLNGDAGNMKGVRRLLYEIIYNLCDNAIKYNRPDGNVYVEIEEKLDTVLLTVKDTGIGIPMEDRDKIFERFYRVDKSHSKSSGGTGLGLSIVKHAAEYHHACIHLESEDDKGTSISLLFTKEC